MRLGILAFGEPLPVVKGIGDDLRARDFDVIVASDEPIPAREEAKRLGRADCDGVLFTLGDGVEADDIAEAVLHVAAAACPILLVAPPEAAGAQAAEAWKTLQALTPACDTLFSTEATADRVALWLEENGKTERQRGTEAAYKLYGIRLFTGGAAVGGFDGKMRWLKQFGILLRADADPESSRPDDLHAPEGDLTGALTERLLHLVSGSEDIHSFNTEHLRSEARATDAGNITVAHIAPDGSGFRAVLFQGVTPPDDNFGGEIRGGYAVAGKHLGAMRAACDALDISVTVLRGTD